jgi:zinc protease
MHGSCVPRQEWNACRRGVTACDRPLPCYTVAPLLEGSSGTDKLNVSIAAGSQITLRIPTLSRVLGNGLHVVVHEARRAPIAAVHLMYHAGSRHERPGRTGLAHLLEHLMFEGTPGCPKGQFDRLLESVGGTSNGSTWLDRTNYYEVVPSHAVELPLWLEQDRNTHFLDALDEEMLEIQRGVVINERLQAYENRPYGLAEERLHQLLFGPEHPYSWPTIGYGPDLEEIEIEDVRDFYRHHYSPANAVLVLAGDVEAERAFDLAERYFGELRGPPPTRVSRVATRLPGGARDVLRDRVSFPRLYRGWLVPAFGSADWTALDVLAYVLADGESSALQRTLAREYQLVQDVDTYLYPTELGAVFGLVATARSGVDAQRLEAAVDRELARVASGGITDQEVAGAVRRILRDKVDELAQVEERAEEIAYATTLLGRADALEEVLASYASVTRDEVVRVAAEYLAEEGSATLWVLPRGGAPGGA